MEIGYFSSGFSGGITKQNPRQNRLAGVEKLNG